MVLIGAAGSGKSTFAKSRFRLTEILSSDFFRGMVCDDEGDQEATEDAFTLLHTALEMRLRRGKLCVVDATNIKPGHRAKLIECARSFQRKALAIVFDTSMAMCLERAARRTSRKVSEDVIRQHVNELTPQRDEDYLGEGFASVHRVGPNEQVEIRRTMAAWHGQ